MTIAQKIDSFLAGAPHAVVGASTDRTKYGNRVLRAYLQAGRPVHPVNPKAAEVEGLKAFPDLRSLPEAVHGISVITPPAVTEKVVEVAAELGIRRAEQAGINVIADGSCALIVLGFQED
ncbi:MAG: CoA-binding protein [Planctomycetota bacterium]|jgi:predicted CoA-binding protein